jgi:RNA polymerase sigma-70 factor (ECF subfamily)
VTVAEQESIFTNWLSENKGLIFKVVRAYTMDPMARDDLFQEITIQVWRSIPGFRHESAVGTWIYRIALNTAIGWRRKERNHDQAAPLQQFEHLLQDRPQVDDQLDWLYNEIRKLDQIDRSIALLLLDDYSYQEIADVLGTTPTNVGVKIHRIKKHLISKSKLYVHHGI